ncbi:MSMEG_0565 family glycosyltransferase [Williamsia sp. SKLECPSW1]
MRIALVTYSTRPRGGVVHTLNLAEALARAGASVSVWSLARDGDPGFFRPVDPAVEVNLVPFAAREDESVADRIVRSIEALSDGIDRTGHDIVHAQDCISANAVGHCVRTVHHLDTFTTPVLVRCHENAIVTPYAHICVSAAVAAEVEAGWGITATVIPNGVDAARFRDAASDDATATADRAAWRDRLGRFVLAVGGIEPRKGSIDLLEAWASLRSRHPDIDLVIAGGETLFDYRDYRAAFDRRAVELKAHPTVLGPVAEGDLPSLVAACDAFAFPSIKEGFGLAAMEALAAGRPVVTRDLPVLREVFGDTVSYAGGVDDLASTLATALTTEDHDPDAGRRLAESLTWDAAARSHLDFYERNRSP